MRYETIYISDGGQNFVHLSLTETRESNLSTRVFLWRVRIIKSLRVYLLRSYIKPVPTCEKYANF